MVRRPIQCTMSYQNEDGDVILEQFEGLWARVALHEYDHMIGQNFTQRVSRVKLDRAIKKAKKFHKKLKRRIENNK